MEGSASEREFEATTLASGKEEVENALDSFASRAGSKIDICLDRQSLAAVLGSGAMERVLTGRAARGFRIRCLTDIGEENEAVSHGLAGRFELRHVDGLTGDFALSDSGEYVSPLATSDGRLGQLIHSNARALFEKQQALFDSLWESAVPAERRLAELSGAGAGTATRLVMGEADSLKTLQDALESSDEFVGCFTAGAIRRILGSLPEAAPGGVERTRREGGRTRWVTSVGPEDAQTVQDCLVKGMAIRHVGRLPVLSFGCGTGSVVASIEAGGRGLGAVIASNEPAYVDHLRRAFEDLWEGGVDPERRPGAARKGDESAGLEVIQDRRDSMEAAAGLARGAQEVRMLFSTPEAFAHQVGPDGLERAKGLLGSPDARVRVLVPDGEEVASLVGRMKEAAPNAEVRVVNGAFRTGVSTLVIDRRAAIVFETKDGSTEEPREPLGSAAVTESRQLADVFATVFDGIWRQAELYEQLENQDKMRRDFVSIAAHELRTPVQAIINYAELARSYEEDREEYYEKLLKSVLKLQKLTEDILDVARIENRSLRLNKEVFLLNEVLRSAADEQRRSAAKKGVRVYLEQAEPAYVFGDKSRIGQVLANLVSNAVKFTDAGSVRVAAKLEKRAGRVTVWVTDTGAGIDRSVVPLLFTRFVKRSESGTGLGLFISRSIIEAHDGRIWVEKSELGKGSTFTFELPVSYVIFPRRAARGQLPRGAGTTALDASAG